MARPLRLCFAGACYHVMARGNAKSPIFLDTDDYRKSLEILEETARRYSLVIYAYCLMPNHYHLVLQTRDGNLSAAIQYLNAVYSQWWNRRHGRCGHVFQGRFKAQLVQREQYLVAACLYVLKNPVRAGIVDRPGDWVWSSYGASCHAVEAPECLESRLVHSLLRQSDEPAAGQSRGNGTGPNPAEAAAGAAIRTDARLIGDEGFLQEHRDLVQQAKAAGMSRREWRTVRPTLSALIPDSSTALAAPQQLLGAHDTWGFTLAEIATHLNVPADAVGRAIRRLRRSTDNVQTAVPVKPASELVSVGGTPPPPERERTPESAGV
ncbi:MAG TPA: transposase [Vicinamibacterales bacterium]|nr:transposase [Vicinamibacterales bacterium]HPK71975.1 transposase [Vicinamibacterales bacterium]HPW20373.1 transposase [Vicinamibacterales bacterium]